MSAFSSLFSVFQSPAPSEAQVPSSSQSSARAQSTGDSRTALESAFVNASHYTGLPFDFFMTTAIRESSLDVNAAASTSSARGPFQFIEQTWLSMVHAYGDELGLGREADAIERRSDGRFIVRDADARDDVLNLRYDPQLSAIMTGRYVQENAIDLGNALGRTPTVGEGYVAHVFGPSGASRLISLAEQQPNRVAADVFPTQAAANRGLFYDRSGSPVSVSQLYERLVDGFPSTPIPLHGFVSSTDRPSAPQASSQVSSGGAVQLEPQGFDALPVEERVAPDALNRLGLFTADGASARDLRSGALDQPFFAALYHPDGIGAGQLPIEATSTHGASLLPGSSRDAQMAQPIPNPVPRPSHLGEMHGGSSNAQIPAPMDLIQFVRSGELASIYTNPVSARSSVELLPPV